LLSVAEKRAFTRVKLNTPIRYQIRGSKEFNNTLSQDISLNGLGFVNASFIPPKSLMMLEIKVASRIIKPIAKVASSYSPCHSERYRIGAEFVEVDPIDKQYLDDYITMKLQRV
jgi:c-di-GMP-binding flagellar brake protein YcgR